jgi:glycosyltransferase involved in cell wall biosynthesis
VGLRRAAKLLLINNQDASFAEKYYKREAREIFIFKNGVYPSILNETIQPSVPTILFLGSWLDRKGISTLIKAAQILERKSIYPNWLLAGTGFDREAILPYWPESMQPFVEVIPKFVKEYEENYFARASLFVLPSHFEGQPLALLQAMETGRCCITTDCCGQRDLIRDEFNGLLHKPGDATQLALLIERCLADKNLLMTIGKNAKSFVQQRRWESVSAEVVDFTEELMR